MTRVRVLVYLNLPAGARQTFTVNRWFATDKPPNQISQVLFPGNSTLTVYSYTVTAHTSNVKVGRCRLTL